ncbi:MAG: hypothetical protein HC895_02190 [Leptolyngbyaceae cyanobacterium SM1_3_5]|nr:hypothetical protein [Leptolyngbyaceae cyanobacterium SM1_3_5]
MLLQELQEQVLKLSVSDRLALISAIVTSLQTTLTPQADKKILINQMRSFLKTEQAPPTDAEVQAMLEERLLEKYL